MMICNILYAKGGTDFYNREWAGADSKRLRAEGLNSLNPLQ